MKKSSYFIPIAILALIAINLGLIFSSSSYEEEKVRDFEISVDSGVMIVDMSSVQRIIFTDCKYDPIYLLKDEN